jgi:hypothetical protein
MGSILNYENYIGGRYQEWVKWVKDTISGLLAWLS